MSCCSEDELRKCFDEHAGPDGKLSRDELKKMVEEKMGCKIPVFGFFLSELQYKGKCPDGMDHDLFTCLDKDEDGQLSWDEFKVVAEKINKCKETMGPGPGPRQQRCNK
uniref:EF-hand domain-containing protein n=1 Tax=Neogobius melanostomus TaxID=47308 RepID=A0A8C6WE64_9GOBI